jgi:hypothetical protein
MKGWAAFALAALAGCDGASSTATCDGVAGACILLDVESAGRDAITVDQIEVMLDGATMFDGLTPPTPGAPMPLPLRTTILLHDAFGSIDITVAGRLHGDLVGVGTTRVDIALGGHLPAEVFLFAARILDGGIADRPVRDFAPVEDLSLSSDLAPLADLASPFDLASPPDQTPAPRLVFILPPTRGMFGGVAAADQACTAAANAAHYPQAFAAILGAPGEPPPSQRIALGGRDIALVDYTLVATDATLWGGNLIAPIWRQADGQIASASCVWTDMLATGALAQSDDDSSCASWSDGSHAHTGVTGDPLATGATWADAARTTCDTLCHIYCIEQ